jgi:hypothetical protein
MLAGIGIGALLFGGAGSAGLWLLAAIPLFIFFKIALFGLIFGAFVGRGAGEWRRSGYGPPWMPERPSRVRRNRSDQAEASSGNERFEEWHRMAHARDEVESWAPKPE